MHNDERIYSWELQRPQRYVFSGAVFVAMIAVMATAVSYLSQGTGGVVPILMITVAPVLAVYYIWYFNFSEPARAVDKS